MTDDTNEDKFDESDDACKITWVKNPNDANEDKYNESEFILCIFFLLINVYVSESIVYDKWGIVCF